LKEEELIEIENALSIFYSKR